jgi:hypothetical protein
MRQGAPNRYGICFYNLEGDGIARLQRFLDVQPVR